MKTIFYVLIFLCFSVLLLANLVDIFSLIKNIGSYEKMYSIGNSDHIQFYSITNYIIWRSTQIVIYIYLMIFSFNRLVGLNINFGPAKLFVVILGLTIIWFIYFFVVWVCSDFDHYPGFDPYLF